MIRLLLTPFFAVVVLWTWFGLPPRSDSAEVTELLRLNSRGVAFMEQLDYKAAGNEFSRLLELDPDFVPGHVNLGVALFNQQLHEEVCAAAGDDIGNLAQRDQLLPLPGSGIVRMPSQQRLSDRLSEGAQFLVQECGWRVGAERVTP